jgi:FemAB-related protein (PEP-CTERM system-associated)
MGTGEEVWNPESASKPLWALRTIRSRTGGRRDGGRSPSAVAEGTPLSVRCLAHDPAQRWDEYLLRHPESTLFHLSAWKRALERSFGFEPRYLVAEENGAIRGVLPLFLVSNLVTGRALISVPFGVYGGIVADDEAAGRALREAACHMAQREKVQFLELRERMRLHGDGFTRKQLYVTFGGPIGGNPEDLFRQLPKDTRYMIRKSQKNGVQTVTGAEHLPAFYELYAHSVHRLGTPVFSRLWFQTLLAEFGDAAEITLAVHEGKPVAGVFSFRFRDWILPYYAGSLPEGRKLAANNFLYWQVMRSAGERGLQYFDFGRSKVDSGSRAFKTQWNMTEHALPYQFYLVGRKSMPNFSPANPRFQIATAVWKRVPFRLTKLLGPALVRLFP